MDYTLRLIVDGDSSGATSALRSASGALKSFGSNAMMAGGILTAGLTLPILAIGKAAIESGTKLNAAMANIGSMGIAAGRVNELKKSIQDLSMQTGKSTDDLAKGTYQIISAYGDSADTAKILEVNTKIAAAGVASLSDTVATVAIITKNWGDTTVAAQQHVGDQLLKTVALGTTTLPELSASLGGVAPQAHAAGLSTNELFAIMATGSGVAGNTSQVVTELSSVLAAFQKPGKDMQKVLRDNGFASGEAMIKTLGFNAAILKTKEYADKTGTSLLTLYKRKEATNLVTALSSTLQGDYNNKLKQYNNISGETDMAYDAQANGANKAGHALEIMQATIQVVLQKINDGMGPALLSFASLMQPVAIKIMDIVDAFSAMSSASQTWIVGIAGAAAAVGPLLLAVGGMARAAAFFLPMIPAIGMVTLALGGLYAAYKLNLFGLGNFVRNGIERLKNAAPLAGKALKELWSHLTDSKSNILQSTTGIRDFVSALTGSQQAGVDAAAWVAELGVQIGGIQRIFETAGGGINGFVASLGKLTGAAVTVDVKSQVTSVDWTSALGNLDYTYDAKSQITTVDWTTKVASLSYAYDAKAGITSVNWTGLLSQGGFVYDATAGITKFNYNETGFNFVYDAKAGITSVDWKALDFTYTYDATSGITKVDWNDGAFTHTYDAKAQVGSTSVLWGYVTHTYDAYSKINSDSIDWGAYTHVYSATSDIKNVLWGAWFHSYDAKATVDAGNILWGAWTHAYNATSQIGQSDVLWGAYTHTYSATGEVTSVLWGLFTNVYDVASETRVVNWGDFTYVYSATSKILAVGWGNYSYIYDATSSILSVGWGNFTTSYNVSAEVRSVLWGAWTKTYDVTANVTSWIANNMPSWLGGGGGGGNDFKSGGSIGSTPYSQNATGTSFWRGGLSWVGENGPELVNLPRSTQVYSHGQSMAMAGAGGGDTHIHMYNTINTPIDVERIAYRVSQIQKQRGR